MVQHDQFAAFSKVFLLTVSEQNDAAVVDVVIFIN